MIVYYNVRKMCEKNPFVIKDTHLLLKEFLWDINLFSSEYYTNGKSSRIQKEIIFLQSWNIGSFTQPFTDYKWTYWLYCIDMIWSYSPTSFPTIEQSNRTKDQSKPNRKEKDEAYRVLLLASVRPNFGIGILYLPKVLVSVLERNFFYGNWNSFFSKIFMHFCFLKLDYFKKQQKLVLTFPYLR